MSAINNTALKMCGFFFKQRYAIFLFLKFFKKIFKIENLKFKNICIVIWKI